MASNEVEQAKAYLHQTRTGVAGATKGLTEAQWNFKPAPDRWSIAEILEHMVVIQEVVLGPVRERLASAPAAENQDTARVDAIIMYQFPDRMARLQGPDAVQPSGRLAPSDALPRLFANYDRLTGYLESTPDLRRHHIDSLPLKAVTNGAYQLMDGYQWILAAGAHTARHTNQILEVKADAGFPCVA